GIIVSLGMLLQFLPQQLAGKYADRHGRKLLMSIGFIIFILGLIPLSFSKELWVIVGGVAVFYLGMGILDPALQNSINENSDRKKGGLWYGLMFFSYFVGSIGSNTMVNVLGEQYTAQFYFKLVMVVLFLEWVLQLIFFKDVYVSPQDLSTEVTEVTPDPNVPSKPSMSTWKLLMSTPGIRNIVIFFVLDGIIWGVSVAIYNGGLVAEYGITKEDLALIILVFNVSNMLLQIPAGHFVDKIGKRMALIISEVAGFVFFALNIVAFFMPQHLLMPMLLISNALLGITVSLFIPAMFTVSTTLSTTRKAEMYGLLGVLKGIAFMPTALIGGFLIEKVSYITPFIITLIGIPIEIWFLIKYFPKDGDN
ncbi:MAG: MFS transporter, partial [Promethearchaeota archaeon]